MVVKSKKEITLSALLKIVFRRWKLFCSIAVVTTILGVLAISLVYNQSKRIYTTTFSYDIPSLKDSKYIDGTKFEYRNLISLSTLTKVKNSNSNYESIDVESIIEYEAISIDRKADGVEDGVTDVTYYYTIEVKQKYFKDRILAREFLLDVINLPIDYTVSAQSTINRNSNLIKYSSTSNYEEQISYLKAQQEYLLEEYSILIEDYGDLVVDGRNISDYVDEIETYFVNSISLQSLANELKVNGYSSTTENEKYNLEAEKQELTSKMKYNQEKIDALEEKVDSLISSAAIGSYDISSYNEKIVELTVENVDYQERIDEISIKLDAIEKNITAPSSFTQTIDNHYKKLVVFTNEFKSIESTVVEENSNVTFNKVSYITVSGGLGIPMATGISGLIGILLAACVNLILDRKYIYEED